MTRGTAPVVHCDADDGLCGAWDIDNYEAGASAVNGVPVTASERSPGWHSGGDEDYCPEHAPRPEEDARG